MISADQEENKITSTCKRRAMDEGKDGNAHGMNTAEKEGETQIVLRGRMGRLT